jgi:hypothetical protein
MPKLICAKAGAVKVAIINAPPRSLDFQFE